MKAMVLGAVAVAFVLLGGVGCRQAVAGGTTSVAEAGEDGGVTASVATGASAPTLDVVSPSGVAHREADPEVWEIVGKIPKPEAMIFENRADTPIPPVDDKKSFLDRIGDPVRKDEPPSEGNE